MRLMIREGKIERSSKETNISAAIVLDGQGKSNVDTGIGFFNHMLNLLAAHGGFNLSISCRGDLDVDGHHTVEDLGIVLGKAFKQAVGDKQGIARYGTFFLPMDESLAMISL